MMCRPINNKRNLFQEKKRKKYNVIICMFQSFLMFIVTPEERKQKNALNAPYFLVALKDTEIMMNTYLRFMVKVKGSPNPEVKL